MPKQIAGHPAVQNHARRLGLKSSETLLDKSYHYAAMKNLNDSHKRGRPDIVHFALMEALSTPLFLSSTLRIYVHTMNDKIIAIADNLRIPKSYFRFEGLMLNLFKDKVIKSEEGTVLMEIADGTIANLLEKIKPTKLIGLSRTGIASTAEKVAAIAGEVENCTFVIGAFPRGHFTEKTTRLLGEVYSISSFGLESHVVIARLVYECEKILLEKSVDHKSDEQRRKVRA